jgi:hypothetical protein
MSLKTDMDTVRRKKYLSLLRIKVRFLGCTAHSLITVLTELSGSYRRALLKRKIFHVSDLPQGRRKIISF